MSAASISQVIGAASAGPVQLYGSTPAFNALVAARLAAANDRLLVVVTDSEARARDMERDIRFFMSSVATGDGEPVLRIPAMDTSPYAELSADRGARVQRMAAMFRLAHPELGVAPSIVVVSANALLRRVILPAELAALSTVLRVDEDIDRDDTASLLLRAGYARAPIVEDPGTFAVRGGVVDLFPPMYSYPCRVELFGDTIESLRFFDPQSQRTLRQLDELHIHPVRETILTSGAEPRKRILEAADAAMHPSKSTRKILEAVDQGEEFVGIDALTPAFHTSMAPLWSYFGDDQPTWLICDPDGVMRTATDDLEGADQRFDDALADHRIAFSPDQHYIDNDELTAALSQQSRVEVRAIELYSADGDDTPGTSLKLSIDDNRGVRSELERARQQQATELIQPLVDAIGSWRKDGWRIVITSDNTNQRDRLAGLLREYEQPPVFSSAAELDLEQIEPGSAPVIVSGLLTSGFAFAADQLVVLTEDDLFGPRRHTSRKQRRAAKKALDALLGNVSDFSQLSVGDYLVHALHGVGLYKGLVKLPFKGTPIDFLHLEYVGGKLYLPMYRLNEVQRYIGAEGLKPRIDRLGGVTWEKAKRKVSQKVHALAEELLQLYAQRAALPGHAFPPADAMFHEFEATFPFEETPDQHKAIEEVLADMESSEPMDRLVCGDVGYGKTEVALRAALRAVLGGKQVAMLAPTTVLVEQHFRTMTERFKGWPLEMAKLSRFQSKSQQSNTVLDIAQGRVDVVVGTHRLLQKDIRFKDLGLLIIDEEQRFGVTHKERLKKLRTQLDVLTLTATPIPRTLHLAMTGMRNLSIIATPPADRRSIRTFISREDDNVLREGIRRELSRGGQIFFVAPRIGHTPGSRDRTLGEWADHLSELVPDARVVMAHGQMSGDALEKVMVKFVAGEHDILVSTTIIESGLDIPRANTMFVARADRFGLSQLYQLRGRIGRSKHRAFCYLLIPSPAKLADEARRRLEALQRFSDLGAGFQIASHDLEIRGAGELLGAKQSGSIAAVGFETYTAMLKDAVAQLRGEAIQQPLDPELNVEVPGYIPDDYVPDTGQRLDLYKRLAGVENEDDVTEILAEIVDRYGTLPDEVGLLADLNLLKAHARRLAVVSLELTGRRMVLAFAEHTPLAPQKVLELVNAAGSSYKLSPDMRLQRSFSEAEASQPTQAARHTLLELLAYVT